MFEFKLPREFKNKRVSFSSNRDIEPQEVFLDHLAQKKQEEIGVSEKKMETPLSRKILQSFYILSLILIFGLFLKTFQFQVLEQGKFLILAEENKTRTYPIRAERGVIYDSKGKQLVWNQVSFDLICDKQDLPRAEQEREKLFQEVAKLIGKESSFIKEKLENSESAKVLILKNLGHKTLISFEIRSQNEEELPGFRIEENIIRDYKDGAIFSHLIGYTGNINRQELETFPNYSVNDYIGKTGLEKFYEDTLRGKPGEFLIEKDAFGDQKIEKKISSPESGANLVLNLDSNLQKKIKESLDKTLKRVGAEKAAVVALNPNNGGVLAMVSLPNFDNNLFSQGISQEDYKEIIDNPLNPLFNKAISGIGYPTGSIIKPLIGTAALEEGIVTSKTKFYCQGKISVQDQWNPEIQHDFHDWKIHGSVDIYKAIAESCNVFFYIIGGGYEDFKGLGPTKIKKWLENFGWGSMTGIDLPQEGRGVIPDPAWKKEKLNEPWYDGDSYHLSIGQGYISITPLQVATAFSAIANGGTLYQPQVVQKIEPKVLKQDFIAQENLKIIQQGMRETVAYGSAVNWLNSLPVKAAAKTGTAQTAKKGYYHSWVTVFAPYDNPEIVLTVMVEDVEEGQIAALPVAKDVLEWYFNLDKVE